MSPAMTPARDRVDRGLLDEDAWDCPDYLTDVDLHAHAGPGWRREASVLDDREDDP
jgi:hypothetical protein